MISSSTAKTWERLGVVWTLIILCITTMPWSNFTGHSHWQQVRWLPFSEVCVNLWFAGDVLGNILLFVPLGWCVVLAQPYQWRNQLRRIVFAAAVLSLSVEFFQVFCHNRSPAMSDVCTNILGAVLGALLALRCQNSGERHSPLGRTVLRLNGQ